MDNELDELQEAARPLGLYVGQHRSWKAGPYYVAKRAEHNSNVLKYATAEQVRSFLDAQPLDDGDKELASLQRAARSIGLHVERDSFGGEFFVYRHRYKNEQIRYLLKYGAANQVENCLKQYVAEREAEEYAA